MDYANTLLVGSSARPITDRLRISREKLAFLVDATAAPITSVALISSWTGIEVSFIATQYKAVGLRLEPYMVFLQTLPYRFYPWLMLAFTLMVALSGRDFGPMWRAERRARRLGKVSADGAQTMAQLHDEEISLPSGRRNWIQGILPVVLVVATAAWGMVYDGKTRFDAARAATAAQLQQARAGLRHAKGAGNTRAALEAIRRIDFTRRRLLDMQPGLRPFLSHARASRALLWASMAGGLSALLLVLTRRVLSLHEAMQGWIHGLRAVLPACLILVLAWALSEVCKTLHTGPFLVQLIGADIPPALLPALVLVVAGIVSFATGSSWGTMAVLFPLVVPLTYHLDPNHHERLLAATAAILAGAVWGDHCSPISDTTIVSSMSTGCDHFDHVRTQLPYALFVGLVSLCICELSVGMGWLTAGAALAAGVLSLAAGLALFGRRPDDETTPWQRWSAR
ncbi:MAG: Na+/H+ antiporter NhaC family protein [Polyangiales bacterium]